MEELKEAWRTEIASSIEAEVLLLAMEASKSLAVESVRVPVLLPEIIAIP